MSVSEVSRRYRGGAGGTGFDIGGFPLEPCPDTGHKWIRYVKIERADMYNVEIDAIASVSPAQPYHLWRDAHFDWMDDPDWEADHVDSSGDRASSSSEAIRASTILRIRFFASAVPAHTVKRRTGIGVMILKRHLAIPFPFLPSDGIPSMVLHGGGLDKSILTIGLGGNRCNARIVNQKIVRSPGTGVVESFHDAWI